MRNVIVPVALIVALVLVVVATIGNRSSAAGPPDAIATDTTTTVPQDPYGAPLGGEPPQAEPVPTAPVVAPAASDADQPAADDSSAGGPTSTTTVVGASLATSMASGDGHAHDPEDNHTEEDPGWPDLGSGEFPITSNVAGDYPLEAMVELAEAVLRAEMTGEGREQYPHLSTQLEGPCCEELTINGAVVLFGAEAGDPAKIVLDWQALERGGEQIRLEITESLWWYEDGTWVGEFER